MARATLVRLRTRPLWQVGLVLLVLYLTAFAFILEGLRLLAALSPLLSIAGASLAVAWAFVGIANLRHHDDEWIGS
jgi:hypothetical protein